MFNLATPKRRPRRCSPPSGSHPSRVMSPSGDLAKIPEPLGVARQLFSPLQCPLEDLRSSLHEPSTQRLTLLSGSKVLEGLFPFRVACQGPSTTHASHLATENGGGNHSIGFISSRRLLLKLSMYSQPSHNLQPFPFGGGDPQQRASVDTLWKRSKKKMGNHISGQKCLEGAYAPI